MNDLNYIPQMIERNLWVGLNKGQTKVNKEVSERNNTVSLIISVITKCFPELVNSDERKFISCEEQIEKNINKTYKENKMTEEESIEEAKRRG